MVASIVLVLLGGAYGGYEYQRWNVPDALRPGADGAGLAKEEKARREARGAAERQAALDAERRRKEQEAADARQRQIETEEARHRKELADAAEAEARRKAEAAAEARRKEEERIAILEEASAKEEEARRGADAEEKRRIAEREEARRKEEQRIAALEEARRSAGKRKEDERARLAAAPSDEQRTAFVRQVQQALKRTRCYDGALNGRVSDAQQGLDKFVESANRRGQSRAVRLDLAKASVGDFEAWLKDADAIKDGVCVPSTQSGEANSQRPNGPSQFDGPWTIHWTCGNGCSPDKCAASSYVIAIRGGIVSGQGKSGSVSSSGAARWNHTNRYGRVSTAVTLRGNVGSGRYANTSGCSGTLTARRH
jgi:hypothetical protein